MKKQKHLLKKQKKAHPFTTVYNTIFEDKSLTLRDIGLYVYMLSKPDNWHFSVRGISTQRIESKDTIAKILNNLINNGWLNREAIRKHGKYFTYEYEIFYQKQDTNPSHIQDAPSQIPEPVNRTVSKDYNNKEREGGFYDKNKNSIFKYIKYLEKNGDIKNKEAHKKSIIKKFMTYDKSTIEVFEDWRLNKNIDILLSTFKTSIFTLEVENKIDNYLLSKVTKNNFHIVLLFENLDKKLGIFQLRHSVKTIDNAISFLKSHLRRAVLTNEN